MTGLHATTSGFSADDRAKLAEAVERRKRIELLTVDRSRLAGFAIRLEEEAEGREQHWRSLRHDLTLAERRALLSELLR